MSWIDIWKHEPIRNTEILFMTGDQAVHIGEIFSEEKLRKCSFYSFIDKEYYECDSKTDIEERVIFWCPLPKRMKNDN